MSIAGKACNTIPMDYVALTQQWLERFVIGLNLCPFAAAPFRKGQIRYVLEESNDPEQLVKSFLKELDYLHRTDPVEVETTLIIHPNLLTDFLAYNDFVGLLEDLLEDAGLSGTFQLASFHPDYQFGGVSVNDPANYTNRSPYPMLHILREESVSKAVDQFSEPERIPEMNMKRLREMGEAAIIKYWKAQTKK